MIEFCSKKRMIAAIIVLISISVAVIFFENRLPVGNEMHDSVSSPAFIDNTSKLCYENGGHVETIMQCRACSEFSMKSVRECQRTSYIEKVKCSSSNENFGGREFVRSCSGSGLADERQFWLFECVTALMGAASYVVVHIRQRRLDRLLMEKVHRQIASGV